MTRARLRLRPSRLRLARGSVSCPRSARADVLKGQSKRASSAGSSVASQTREQIAEILRQRRLEVERAPVGRVEERQPVRMKRLAGERDRPQRIRARTHSAARRPTCARAAAPGCGSGCACPSAAVPRRATCPRTPRGRDSPRSHPYLADRSDASPSESAPSDPRRVDPATCLPAAADGRKRPPSTPALARAV